MRRGFLRIAGAALLSASLLGTMGTTSAHPVVVDSAPTEWSSFGTGPNEDDTGHIIRNALGQGEFAWYDANLDSRTISTSPAPREIDMRQVRVTGDATNLSFYITLSGLTYVDPKPTVLNPTPDLPQIQIAIDNKAAAGESRLVLPATITPTVSTGWDYLLQTQFKNGTLSDDLNYTSAPVKVYNTYTTSTPQGQSVIQKVNNSIELQVPWSSIGGFPAANTPVRFTIVSLRESGSMPSPADGNATNILDTVSPRAKGGAKGVANTLDDLSNGVLDYAFDVRFDQAGAVTSAGAGEVFSPLLITEVGLYPSTTSTSGQSLAQWIEITNVSPTTISASDLQKYKIGDATQRDSTEGMYKLPNKALAANGSIIVTRDKASFDLAYPALASSSSVYIANPAATTGTKLTAAGTWASTDLSLRASSTITTAGQPPLFDQVLLLDDKDSIVDLVEYTDTTPLAKPYPDHTAVVVPSVATASNVNLVVNTSLQRCPEMRNTNNRNTERPDWAVSTNKLDQSPLVGNGCALADVGIVNIAGPQSAVVSVTGSTEQNYTISYTNTRKIAAGVLITDTLPLGMQYKAGSTQGASEPTVGTSTDGRTQLVWSVGSVAAGTGGQISFTAVLPANTPAGATSSDVEISTTTREAQSDVLNNTKSIPVTYTTEPAIDLAATIGIVTSGSSASKLYPGGKLVYRMTYTNNGTKTANGITLVDTVPAGLTYDSNSKGFAANTSVPGQLTLTSNENVAASGGFNTVDVVFSISESLASGSAISANTVTVSSPTIPEANPANNTATSTAATLGARPPAADLTATMTVKNATSAAPGGTIVYTVDYANIGQLNVSGVMLTTSFPADKLEYQSNSASPQIVPDQSVAGQVTFGLLPLTAGSKGTLDITFKVKADVAAGTKVSTKSVISTTSDVEEAPITNNASTAPDVEIKSATGGAGSYTIYLPFLKK